MSYRLADRAALLATFICLVCTSAPRANAQEATRPTRVLVLYQQQSETQPMLEFAQRLRTTISTGVKGPVEFYQEALDFDRFGGREQSSPLAGYFDDKYRRFGIDVIIPVGGRALRFAVDRLANVLPNVPIVFALCGEPQTDPADQPANVTGRIAPAQRFAPTLWMATRLQPNAERVVVIGGAGPADSASVATAVSAIPALGSALQTTVLQGLSLDVLLPRLRKLSRNSIFIFANYRQDGRGQTFEPADIIGSIAHAAPGPMYTQLGTYVGEGPVGGSVLRFDDEGVRTGRLVVRVLNRRRGDRMPPIESIAHTFVADWRQLQHWGLPDAGLPAGTEVLFREPTLWQRYRTFILLALGVIAAELLLIGALLLERRLRIRAQAIAEEEQHRAAETRRQITHIGRVALVGELAATMSHELRQPLAAILNNAEVGARVVRRNVGKLGGEERELCAEIFSAIIADDALASDIITRVRALVRKEELPQQPVDLNEMCRTSARVLQYDARTRHAKITLSLDPRLPPVTGDPVQFQQVVLNLTLNALDASAATAHPCVDISTVARDGEVEIAVRDNGVGLAENVRQHLFESFFTTKAHGLGLGLPIVQSIVERHHGRVRAENGEQGGAVFRVMVPVRQSPRRARAPRLRFGAETSASNGAVR
ncbi:MAG TPA: sensor histidine kinase [Gemmatimonadaceae bacterium]